MIKEERIRKIKDCINSQDYANFKRQIANTEFLSWILLLDDYVKELLAEVEKKAE